MTSAAVTLALTAVQVFSNGTVVMRAASLDSASGVMHGGVEAVCGFDQVLIPDTSAVAGSTYMFAFQNSSGPFLVPVDLAAARVGPVLKLPYAPMSLAAVNSTLVAAVLGNSLALVNTRSWSVQTYEVSVLNSIVYVPGEHSLFFIDDDGSSVHSVELNDGVPGATAMASVSCTPNGTSMTLVPFEGLFGGLIAIARPSRGVRTKDDDSLFVRLVRGSNDNGEDTFDCVPLFPTTRSVLANSLWTADNTFIYHYRWDSSSLNVYDAQSGARVHSVPVKALPDTLKYDMRIAPEQWMSARI